ncbi:ECF transporter S component [Clostridioides difficile]|nr:ECF transporter S component [Clostridioides difficile]
MCVKTITLIAFGISINIIGAFIAMGLRLPVYLDSIGTIMIASLLGPKYAVVTGVFGSLISGITFDVYSLYFAPVQISTGLLAGIAFKRIFKRFKNSTRVLLFAIPTSIISSIISAFLFGGMTSSGSSYIVQILKVLGLGDVFSVFITQVFTDYGDKLLAVVLVNLGLNAVPKL